MKTDMPEKIYVFNEPKSIGDLGFTRTDKQEDHEEYTRSDLCVPVSEYDKLKQHADAMDSAIGELLDRLYDDPYEPDEIYPQEMEVLDTALKGYAEYRKETE